MLEDVRCRALLLAATAFLLASCGGGAQPTAQAAEGSAAKVDDKKPDPKPEDKKAPEPVKAPEPAAKAPPAAASSTALQNPSLASEKAPDKFKVKLTTTKGDFVVDVTRDWSPNGADRFFNLVKMGYFTDIAFFRNIQGFMVQFGIHGDPKVNEQWHAANIKDDPVKQSNLKGFITFATGGPNTRTTQLFINFGNNANLDRMGFSPFGQVVEGMNVVESLYNGYGEGAPRGRGPRQDLAQSQGNAYFKKDFPNLDYVKSAAIVP